MQLADRAAERAAHREPHDLLDALGAAEAHVLGMGHAREALGVALEEIEELVVPLGIVEAGALAMNLVRQSAGADDHDLEVLGIGLDRAAHRLAELPAAPRRRQRVLQHVDRERHHRARPVRRMRPQERQRRGATVIERPVLEGRDIELVVDQGFGDVDRERDIALDRRQRPLARALVGDREALADADREGRIEVEEERGRVVVAAAWRSAVPPESGTGRSGRS